MNASDISNLVSIPSDIPDAWIYRIENEECNLIQYNDSCITFKSHSCIESNSVNFCYEITQQMMGGSFIHSDLMNVNGFQFDDMNGSMQLWSNGVQHFTFNDDKGIIIEFNIVSHQSEENVSQVIEDFQLFGLLK